MNSIKQRTVANNNSQLVSKGVVHTINDAPSSDEKPVHNKPQKSKRVWFMVALVIFVCVSCGLYKYLQQPVAFSNSSQLSFDNGMPSSNIQQSPSVGTHANVTKRPTLTPRQQTLQNLSNPRSRLDLRRVDENIVPVHISRDHHWAFYSWMHHLRAGRLDPQGGYVIVHIDTHSDLFGQQLSGEGLRAVGVTQLTRSMIPADEEKWGQGPANYVSKATSDDRVLSEPSPHIGKPLMLSSPPKSEVGMFKQSVVVPVDSLTPENIVQMTKVLTIANYIPAAVFIGADHDPTSFVSPTTPHPKLHLHNRQHHNSSAHPHFVTRLSSHNAPVKSPGQFIDHVVWVRPDVDTEFNKPRKNGEYNITLGFFHLTARHTHPIDNADYHVGAGYDQPPEMGDLQFNLPMTMRPKESRVFGAVENTTQDDDKVSWVHNHDYAAVLKKLRLSMRQALQNGETPETHDVRVVYEAMDWDLLSQGPKAGMPPLNMTLLELASMSLLDGELVGSLKQMAAAFGDKSKLQGSQWTTAATVNELISKVAVRYDGALCCTVDGAIDAPFCNGYQEWDHTAIVNQRTVHAHKHVNAHPNDADDEPMSPLMSNAGESESAHPGYVHKGGLWDGISQGDGYSHTVTTNHSLLSLYDERLIEPTHAYLNHSDADPASSAYPVPSNLPFPYPFPSLLPGVTPSLDIFPHRTIRLSVVSPQEFLANMKDYGLGPAADAQHPLNHNDSAPVGMVGLDDDITVKYRPTVLRKHIPTKRVLLDIDLDFFASGSEWRTINQEKRPDLTTLDSLLPAQWVDACCGKKNPFVSVSSGCCAQDPFRQMFLRKISQALMTRVLREKSEDDVARARTQYDKDVARAEAEWKDKDSTTLQLLLTEAIETRDSRMSRAQHDLVDASRAIAVLLPEAKDVDKYLHLSMQHYNVTSPAHAHMQGLHMQCPELDDIVAQVTESVNSVTKAQAKLLVMELVVPTEGELWTCETPRPLLYSTHTEDNDIYMKDFVDRWAASLEKGVPEDDVVEVVDEEESESTDAAEDDTEDNANPTTHIDNADEAKFMQESSVVTPQPAPLKSKDNTPPSRIAALEQLISALQVASTSATSTSDILPLRQEAAREAMVERGVQRMNEVLRRLNRGHAPRRSVPSSTHSKTTPLDAHVHDRQVKELTNPKRRRVRNYGGRDRVGAAIRQRQANRERTRVFTRTTTKSEGSTDDSDVDMDLDVHVADHSVSKEANAVTSSEKAWLSDRLWREMDNVQRWREEKVSQVCFCNMIQYSEHLPLSTPLSTPTATSKTQQGLKSTPTCQPTHASKYLTKSARWLRDALRLIAPHTDVVTVARSDDYFLPKDLTPDVEWLVLSALHDSGLGISKQIAAPLTPTGRPRMVVKQYVQMEQFLDLSTPPPGMCTRPSPFCVDWTKKDDEMCWTSQYQNEFEYNF